MNAGWAGRQSQSLWREVSVVSFEALDYFILGTIKKVANTTGCDAVVCVIKTAHTVFCAMSSFISPQWKKLVMNKDKL